MSKWTDPEEWARLVGGESCPICRPGAPLDAIAELEVSSVMMGEDAPIRGYCWLLFRRHAVELHDLTPNEGAAYMRDVQRSVPPRSPHTIATADVIVGMVALLSGIVGSGFAPLSEEEMEDIRRHAAEARRDKGPCGWNPDPERQPFF